MLGLVVFGSRTWTCTIAAPALAASIAELAICSGVTGTAGLRPGVPAEPVTAHEIITLRCIVHQMLSSTIEFASRRRDDTRSVETARVHGSRPVGLMLAAPMVYIAAHTICIFN